MAGTEILIGLAISAATSVVTSALAPKPTLLPVDKGRYDDIRVQGSEYGTSIPIVYGRARLAGNIIYSDGVQPHVTTTPGRAGGKFGGGGRPPEPPVNHYSYTTNLAVAICEGEIKGGLKRMWENAKVTMGTDTNPLPDGSTVEAELTTNNKVGDVQIVRDLSASSEYKVFLAGSNSSVSINGTLSGATEVAGTGLVVNQAGLHNIKIIYMGLGNKSARVIVDGVDKGVISFDSTGSDSVSQVKLISHNFTSTGNKIVTIKREGSAPAPYIDAVGIYGATATATATVADGVVTGVTLTSGGGGYTTAPTVQFFGSGSGATATTTVSNGVVTGITLTAGGTGYTTAPTVDITPSVVFTPPAVTGIVNPDVPYNPNPIYQYQYYNNNLIPDANGTASAGLARDLSQPDLYPEDPTNPGGTGSGGTTTTTFGNITFYSGSETQLPDPYLLTLEPGNVPAYRGTSYIVLKNYQIPDGQMPNFTFEVDEGTHNLANILVSLWGRVGLDATQLDVASLDGIFVEGLVINTRTPLSDILEALCIAYAFDFVDLNGKVTAVKRGGASVATILEAELKAHEDGSEVPPAALEVTYIDVKELPKQIDVSFMDRTRSYFQNVEPAIKQIGANEEPQTLVLPLVLPRAQAKEIGNRVLNTIYLQKAQYSFTLPPKYSWLSPSDIITVVMNNGTHKLRVSQFQTGMPGLCKVQAVPDSASLYIESTLQSTIGGFEPPPIPFPAVTRYAFMDIPPLLPEHTGFGFYAAGCGSGVGTWNGARVYREETPNSNSWSLLGGFEVPSIIGVTGSTFVDTTGNFDIGGGKMIDTLSSVVVSLYSGVLESTNSAIDLFNNPNLNLICVGGEVMQFATATAMPAATSPFVRRYTLTNFRRGLNGTTSKVGSHQVGQDFVVLDSSLQWMRIPAGHLFTDYRYKVVSVGVPLEGVQPITFNTGTGSAPPVATNLVCTPSQIIAQDGTTQIVIRGTFSFGTFAGGQRAKIFIKRPTVVGGTTVEPSFFNTGIVVVPDANNNGGFEIPAAVTGRYIIQVVTMSPFDLTAQSGHAEATLDISASTVAPDAPSTPVPTFDGQQVTWTWVQSTASTHSHYKFYTGAGTVLAARIDGNTYTEFPSSGMTRKVTAVNRTGVESAFSGIGTFTMVAPSAPTGYSVAFNGVELIHTWTAPTGATAQYVYEIADGNATVLGTSGTTQWIESAPPSSRSFTRQVRSKLFGVPSASWVSTTVTIPIPAAPTAVAFVPSLATPFDVPVSITPDASMNERQIRSTKVDVMNAAGTVVLQTLYYTGVARTANVSGRFLNAPNNVIKVRAAFTDFIGDGSSTITPDTYTFPAITGGEIGNGTIGYTNIENGAIRANHIQNGIINTAAFAASIRPVIIFTGASLPILPDTYNDPRLYPVGTLIFWTNQNKMYQNKVVSSTETWVDTTGVTSFAGLTGTIAANQISSGTISDDHISAASNFSQILQSNMQARWSGGGDITWHNTNGLTWTARFISLPNALSAQGYFDFTPRTISTLVSTGSNYLGLYRRIRVGGNYNEGDTTNITVTQASAGWFVTSYTSYTATNPPPTPRGYVDYLIAHINNDTSTGSGARCILFDGRIINHGQTIQGNTSVPNRSLVAEQIVAGTITGAEIKAGSITAEKLAIGMQVGNLAVNPSFESTYTVVANDYYNTSGVSVGTVVPDAWKVLNNNAYVVTAASQGLSANTGTYVLRMNANAGNRVTSKGMPVGAGITYLIRANVYGSSASGFSMYIIQGTTVDTNGYTVEASYSTLENSISPAATWGEYGTPRISPFYYTVPAGVSYISLQFALTGGGTVWIDDVVATRQFGSTYIQNGAITTDLISAYAIRAQHLQVGTFSESLQLNSRFTDGNAGYFDQTGNQLPTSTHPVATTANAPIEWTSVTGGIPAISLPAVANATLYGSWIPFSVNETYYIEAWVKPSAAASTYIGLHVDGAGAYNTGHGRYFYVGNLTTPTPDANGWIKLSAVVGAGAVSGNPNNLKWNDFTGYNDGVATLANSRKFRFYIITNYNGGSATVQIAQVSIVRMQTGNLVVNGTITGQHILTNSVHADRIQANTITAGQIQAGAIGADQIAANSIRADKLAIGTVGDNRVLNGAFDAVTNNKADGWTLVEGMSVSAWTVEPDAASRGKAMHIPASVYNAVGCRKIPVSAGEVLSVTFSMYTTATSGSFYTVFEEFNATTTKDYIGYTASGFVNAAEIEPRTSIGYLTTTDARVFNNYNFSNFTANTWHTFTGLYTVPAGVKYITVAFYNWGGNGLLYVDNVQVRPQLHGVIIENGTITGNKLSVNSIDATHIKANSITADKIATRVVGSNLISNNSFESYDAANGNKPHDWIVANGTASAPTWSSSTTQSIDGTRSLVISNSSGTFGDVACMAIAVTELEQFYWSFRIRTTSTTGSYSLFILETNNLVAGTNYVGSAAIDATKITELTNFTSPYDTVSGTQLTNVPLSNLNVNQWYTREGEYDVRAGIKYVSLGFRVTGTNGDVYIDAVAFRRYTSGVEIKDGTIKAPKIQAGAITADKLSIGNFGDNLVMNPSFEDKSTGNVPLSWALVEGSGTFSVDETGAADGIRCLNIPSGGSVGVGSTMFPVSDTLTYAVRFKIKTSATSGNLYVRMNELSSTPPTTARYIGSSTNGEVIARNGVQDLINIYQGENQNLGNLSFNSINPKNQWIQMECNYTPTSNTKYASFSFYNWNSPNAILYVDDIIVTKKVAGVFIENGTITAQNLVIGGMSDNLLANGAFNQPSSIAGGLADGWSYYNNNAGTISGAVGSNRFLQLPSGSGATSKVIPVSPGQKIAVRFLTRADSNGVQTSFNFLFRQTMPSTGTETARNFIGTGGEAAPFTTSPFEGGANVGYTTYTFYPTNSATWQAHEAVMTVPANRYWMSVNPTSATSNTYYDDIQVRRQVGSAFISDIRADQITASQVNVGLIFTDQIKQSNYTPYQVGSIFDATTGFLIGAGTTATNVTYDVGTDVLSFTGSDSWGNQGTVLTQTWQKIKTGTDGYFEFSITEKNANKSYFGGITAGVAHGSGAYFASCDFAFYLNAPQGRWEVYEGGSAVFTGTQYSVGDVYRISIESNYVRYRRNGRLVWTSPYRATSTRRGYNNSDFRGMLTFRSDNGATQTITSGGVKLVQEGVGTGWRLNPSTGAQMFDREPVWTYATGSINNDSTSPDNINNGSVFVKYGGVSSWDTSVVTDQTIAGGDGYIQATPSMAYYTMFGLTADTQYTTPNFNTINHACYLVNGNVQIYENGTPMTGNVTTYVSGDSFRVGIEGNFIKYRKNGGVFYERPFTNMAQYSAPYRGKISSHYQNDRLINISFTAATSGAGEFNSGITVRGQRIEDVVKLATQAIRGDNRYRGNDVSVPSNQISGITLDTYYISWEDDMWYANVSVTVNDYKSNATKNMDSLRSVRARVYSKTGQVLKTITAPWNGRGVVFSGHIPRKWADAKQEAVFSFEFENLYGFSEPVWFSEAPWKTSYGWVASPIHTGGNISYSAPNWMNAAHFPTNVVGVPLTTDSVRVTWVNSTTYSGNNHDVYYRVFKPSGYEGNASNGGWIYFGSTTTGTMDITGLQSNVRYEVMVQISGGSSLWSNTAHVRTFLLAPAPSVNGAPTSLAGSASGQTAINLSWVKNDTSGYTGTEIRYVSGTGTPTAASSLLTTTTATTATLSGLSASSTYSFRARNMYGGTASDWSNTVTVTTQAAQNNTLPSGVVVSASGYYALSVDWVTNGWGGPWVVQVALETDAFFTSPVYTVNDYTRPRLVGGLQTGTSYVVRVSGDGGSTWSETAYGYTNYYSGGCVLETESITMVGDNDIEFEIMAKNVKVGDRVLGSHAGTKGLEPAAVTQIKRMIVDKLATVTTEKGYTVKCSETHKIITSWDDTTGVAVHLLNAGNTVMVYDKINGEVIEDRISSITYETGEFAIIKLSLDSADHTYIGEGILAHNRKPEEPYPQY